MNPISNKYRPVCLDEKSKLLFRNTVERIMKIPADPTPDQLIRKTPRLANIYKKNKKVLKALKDLVDGKRDYVLFENMPIDSELCATPQNGKRPIDKKFFTSELALLSLMIAAGLVPFSYFEENPELIHQVSVVKEKENTNSSNGKVSLLFHSDNAFLDPTYRLEFLALLGLRNESNTPTMVSSINKAVKHLLPKYLAELMKPQFRIFTPDSFTDKLGGRVETEPKPIITQNNRKYFGAGNVYGVNCMTEEAKIALKALDEALQKVSEKIIVKKSTLLIFNNDLVWHSRAAVEGDRFLQRCFGKKSVLGLRKDTMSGKREFIFPIHSLLK